ncbi:hypothetical protein [Streptomyces sp. AC1-42T]|uniref:hypothetical protein n=1 Tax=unclassified Streptomyces TaxID=2593676 RepID=UPI00406CC5E3
MKSRVQLAVPAEVGEFSPSQWQKERYTAIAGGTIAKRAKKRMPGSAQATGGRPTFPTAAFRPPRTFGDEETWDIVT